MLFRKDKKQPKPEEKQNKEAKAPEQTVKSRRMAISSGRMSSLYQRLYVWIFSVNISMDVYQIESGEDQLSAKQLPIRGYYHDLLMRVSSSLIDEHRADFISVFSKEAIVKAIENDRSFISASFCGNMLAPLGQGEPLHWYEFRAEWPSDVNKSNIVLAFSVKPISSDIDTGHSLNCVHSAELDSEGKIDWTLTRSKLLNQRTGGMDFEYDLGNDCFILHRDCAGKESTRVLNNFLATLATQSDFLVSHESVRSLKALLQNESTVLRSDTILFRKDGSIGSPFNHYKVSALCTDVNAGKWVLGSMENIEKQALEAELSTSIITAINRLMDIAGIDFFYINTEQKSIAKLVQDQTGFHREGKAMPLGDYIQKRISSGRLEPEYQTEYLKWLEPGYLQRKTIKGSYGFEARMKDMGDAEAKWYCEKIIAISGKPGQFLRWRENASDRHKTLQAEYDYTLLEKSLDNKSKMLDMLANLIEFRSIESSEHIMRVRTITRILLDDIKKRCPEYELTNSIIEQYVQAATVHDIGKISVPDYILNKEGRYTEAEFAIMKKHTTQGAAIIDRVNITNDEPLVSCMREVALHHHERLDGKGYPDGLSGDEIDIGVHAVGLADVYDALVSIRCYKTGYPQNEALQMILEGKCGAFNPKLLEALKDCHRKIISIYEDSSDK